MGYLIQCEFFQHKPPLVVIFHHHPLFTPFRAAGNETVPAGSGKVKFHFLKFEKSRLSQQFGKIFTHNPGPWGHRHQASWP